MLGHLYVRIRKCKQVGSQSLDDSSLPSPSREVVTFFYFRSAVPSDESQPETHNLARSVHIGNGHVDSIARYLIFFVRFCEPHFTSGSVLSGSQKYILGSTCIVPTSAGTTCRWLCTARRLHRSRQHWPQQQQPVLSTCT